MLCLQGKVSSVTVQVKVDTLLRCGQTLHFKLVQYFLEAFGKEVKELLLFWLLSGLVARKLVKEVVSVGITEV